MMLNKALRCLVSLFFLFNSLVAIAAYGSLVDAAYIPASSAGNFETYEACNGSSMTGQLANCGSGNPLRLGSDPFITFSQATQQGSLQASADLRDGTLRLALPEFSSSTVLFSDTLTFSIAGLGQNDVATIVFLLDVQGTYGRSVGQDRGQANFSFSAQSGVMNGVALTDEVSGTALYRTSSSSNSVNSTASPEEFSLVNVSGDWTQSATDLFRASVDIVGSDPTIAFSMSLIAGGPADFSHTAGIDLALPAGASFTSSSGVFLADHNGTQIPEPATLTLLMLALVGLVVRCKDNPRGSCF